MSSMPRCYAVVSYTSDGERRVHGLYRHFGWAERKRIKLRNLSRVEAKVFELVGTWVGRTRPEAS